MFLKLTLWGYGLQSPLKVILNYSTYARHAHVQFHKQFIQNKYGYACKICDRLWFQGNLNLIDDNVEFVRTFLQNVFTSAMWS